MNLIATETGRVLQLIVMEEIRPPSGIYMPSLYQAIAERYAFVGRPQDVAQALQQGAIFQHGRVATPTRTIVINQLGIYTDGVIIDATNTDDAEFVAEDLLNWATATFAFRERRTNVPRTFTSVVTVEFDGKIEPALRGFESIAARFSAALKNAYGWDLDIGLLQLGVNADPLAVPPFRNTRFYLERRIGRPYNENRYQSGAPLRTEDHITLLQTIERDLLC